MNKANQTNALMHVTQLIHEKKTEADRTPYFIAVGGPGGSGKSTFAKHLADQLEDACVLTLDDYKTSRAFRKQVGIFGPHPDANKITLIQDHLANLKKGHTIDKPLYDMTHGDSLTSVSFPPKQFIIVEGEVSTYACFEPMIDFSIFIDAGLLTQLAARLGRDQIERGHSKEKASLNFLHSNLREFPAYGAATRHGADVRLFCREDYHLEIEPLAGG